MASAARKQAVPQISPGVDTEAAMEAFSDPTWRLNHLYSIRTRDGSVIKFTPPPSATPRYRPAIPAGLSPDHHPEGEAAWLLDALGRHLRGPTLLRVGAANLTDRPNY